MFFKNVWGQDLGRSRFFSRRLLDGRYPDQYSFYYWMGPAEVRMYGVFYRALRGNERDLSSIKSYGVVVI